MTDLIITKQTAEKNKKELLLNLDYVKKGVLSVLNNDLKSAKKYSNLNSLKSVEKHLRPIMFDIIKEISKTYCDENHANKSTALTSKFNRNWTIGSFGSIFVDLIVKNQKLRVSFITKEQAVEYNYNKPFFWVETLKD